MNNLEIIFTEPRKVALIESAIKKPEDKEVLVKVKYNLISAGTEKAWLLAMENAKGKFPFNAGYSSVGIVVEVGKEVKKFKCGDRVFVAHGGHASYNIKNEGSVIKIPNEVSFEAAVFTRMASFPLLAIRRARLEIGESAVVVGLGMVGLFGVQIARLGGVMPLVAVGNRDIRREKAYKYGADLVLSPDDPELVNKIIDFTYERNQVRGANCVIETSGSERGIIDSLKYVSFSGRLLLNGCNRINEEPIIAIGKALRLSPPFPPLHTGHATFIAPGVPSNQLTTLHRGSTLYALTVHIVLTNFTCFCTSESSLIPFRLYLAVSHHC